ncbi:MAG: hypothetical protein CMM48_00550 [Rhodospirillaceae bacterium]|nr:hypothetical protein [Rhodospirillaceae bacterium]
MKRRSRELVIFSMSALDLFASALGAFILVTIVLLPYYLKHDDVVRDNNRMRQQISEMEKTAEKTANELAKAKEEIQKLKDDAKNAGSLTEKLKQAQKRAAEAEKKAAAAKSSAAKSENALKKAESEIKRRVKFALLGLATNAQKFVIVMDMSGSMKQFRNITLQTMQKVLEPMSEKEKVGIIGFHAPGTQVFYTIQLPRWPGPGAIAPMSGPNKSIALSFVRDMMRRVDGGTPTMDGLLAALQYDVDAIILMSDGQPTVPNRNWRRVIQTITQRNRGQKEIHTVAIGNFYERPTFVTFLSQLARANRGKFTGVALP